MQLKISVVAIGIGSLVVLPYLFGYMFSNLLPGCDTAMHGYITRLIIEQNGFPSTYQPLLPDRDFGAYATGFHFLAAMFAMYSSDFLLDGLSLASMLAYLVCLLGLAFLLSVFTKPANAIICAAIAFWFHASLQSTITWGGSPTVLSLGLVFFTYGFIGHSFKLRSLRLMTVAAFSLSAAMLTHAIPAYTGVYFGGFLVLYWMWEYRPDVRFVLKSFGLVVWVMAMLLVPHIAPMLGQSSPELSTMISMWQHKMMGGVVSGDVYQDFIPLLGRLKTSLGDLIMITASIALAVMFLFRMYRQALFVLMASLVLFAIILNTGHWVLPFSELLYPERAMYFYVVPFGLMLVFVFNQLDLLREQGRFMQWWIAGALMVGIGLFNLHDRFLSRIWNADSQMDAPMLEAMQWVEEHTEGDAVFHTDYYTEGMWIPALAYRSTIGTHLHFIHERDRVFELMREANVDHYEFRVAGVLRSSKGVDTKANRSQVVFKNSRVEVVLTRYKSNGAGC